MARTATARREATVRLTVPFYDLDPMQVVFHGNYLKYFERARQALFDQAGIDPYRFPHDGDVLFPVVRSQLKHVRPLRFRDEFDCTARLVDARSKIVIDFEIRRVTDGTLCTRGRTEQVAVRAPALTLELRIPAEVRRALGVD